MFDLIEDLQATNVFSLAGRTAGLVKRLSKDIKVTIAERDSNICQYLADTYPHFYVYHCMASELLPFDVFDFIWLDFCGPMCKEVYESLTNARLSDKGILALTVARNRYREPFDKIPEFYITELGYKIHERIEYQSESPMTFYLLTK